MIISASPFFSASNELARTVFVNKSTVLNEVLLRPNSTLLGWNQVIVGLPWWSWIKVSRVEKR